MGPRFLRTIVSALSVMTGLALWSMTAHATLSSYAKVVATGSAITPSSWTDLYTGRAGIRGSSSVTNTVSGFNMPFTFVLDGVSHTRISVSTNGLISFGSGNASATGSNNLTSTSSTYGQFPRIAAWWDQMYITGGARNYCGRSPAIRWGVSGSAPNRILVVDFRDLEVASRSAAYSSWQVRLYESTNMIEFYYANMTSLSCKYTSSRYSTFATIGIADASNDYITVIPSYSSATMRSTSAYNSVNLNTISHRIPANTIYRFAPCNIALVGDPSQGGTATMSSGDVLLEDVVVQRGNTEPLQPFTINGSIVGCGTGSYSLSITGPAAGDYALSTSSASITPGSSTTPTITFTPTAVGIRSATLRVSDNNGFVRTFALAATGLTRVAWTGDVSQGGTLTLADGDVLMSAIEVRRLSSASFTPLTIRNTNPNESAAPMIVAVAVDSAGGTSYQYALGSPGVVSLAAGESYTPTIEFSALGVGPQSGRLTVTADGETRTYALSAISMAPAVDVIAGGLPATPQDPVFRRVEACVGDALTTIPFVVLNSGTMPLEVRDIAFYQIDTTYQQGTPMQPLLRTDRDATIPMVDYVLSELPGSLPIQAIPHATTPFTVQPGEERTLYLTFVGQVPGKRFARVFMRTNAENITGQDTNEFDGITSAPMLTEGLFVTELIASSLGSRIAAGLDDARLGPIVFDHTRVGESSSASFTIANTGACDLRISRDRLRIVSGDIDEITMTSVLSNTDFDASTGDFVIGPGKLDTIHLRFVPSRNGTRMATLRIQTNDSTLSRPGLSERGSMYLDLSGRGLAGLDASELVLDPVVIGSVVDGVAILENTLNVAVSIASVEFIGDNATEFSESPTAPWPARPFTVLAGEKLRLGVRLTPIGEAGLRRTTLVLVTTDGDTIAVPVRGEAGTQTLVVSATSLFEDVSVQVGSAVHRSVTISNAGTLPLRIASLAIVGIDSLSYRLGMMPRMDLEPGQAEFLEVTYAPTASGQTSAQLVITASNGQTSSVALGGTALKIRRDPVDPASTAAHGAEGTPEQRNDAATNGLHDATLR